MADHVANSNPYVGPRPYQIGEHLYGRDQEIRRIVNMLLADRIVLLHAPSGAGRTSLINAGIVPALVSHDFDVPPVIQIRGWAAPLDPEVSANPYISSAMSSLGESRDTDQITDPAEALGATLNAMASDRPQCIIFDQLEDVFLDGLPLSSEKRDFFATVGALLSDRNRFALFSMQEDFLGVLATYTDLIPGRLDRRFRLELLDAKGARQSISMPAEAAGVPFSDEAATQLLEDLLKREIVGSDGMVKTVIGPYVEPVQLQIVCRRLWDTMGGREVVMDVNSVSIVGDTDDALADFYAAEVSRVAIESGVSQRAIRDWFESELIAGSFRKQTLNGPNGPASIDDPLIQGILDTRLVRTFSRGAALWLELAHDRLVAPIKDDNAEWYAANLSLLSQQAAEWDSQGRSHQFLLRNPGVPSEQEQQDLSQLDLDFLDSSMRNARARRRRRVLLLAVNALLVVLLALTLTLFIAALSP